eukprot:GHVP01008645.1.p1 GENE.GHVP01008645.1~~GHVP01008645.1.p1  ORF type:complete len:143 (-),score=17.16 GHVP01008645.1:69-497(-)
MKYLQHLDACSWLVIFLIFLLFLIFISETANTTSNHDSGFLLIFFLVLIFTSATINHGFKKIKKETQKGSTKLSQFVPEIVVKRLVHLSIENATNNEEVALINFNAQEEQIIEILLTPAELPCIEKWKFSDVKLCEQIRKKD